LKKPVLESILSINATLPIEKVTFFGINLVKRYLLMLLLARSGYEVNRRALGLAGFSKNRAPGHALTGAFGRVIGTGKGWATPEPE